MESTKYLGRMIELILEKPQAVYSDIKITDKFNDGQRRVPLEISGTAFVAGKHRDIVYPESVLEKATTTLKVPCDMDHDNSCRGKVVQATYNNGRVDYIASITDSQLANDIYDGKITKVSPDFKTKRAFKDNETVVTDMWFTRLSLLKHKKPQIQQTSIEII